MDWDKDDERERVEVGKDVVWETVEVQERCLRG